MSFASRTGKEILRDPLNLAFGIGFPVAVLLLLTAIQSSPNTPDELFPLTRLAPGIAVFGLSFVTLFSAQLIAHDRSTSFLVRLFTSPMTAGGFIAGYTLPIMPMAVAQIVICFIMSLILGLKAPIGNILLTIAVLLPVAVFFVAVGLLCGSLFSEKQVGGLCGALLTNLSAWLSGTWFDLGLVGGLFKSIAYVLPFAHAVDAGRAALSGNYGDIWQHLWVVCVYAVVMLVLAVIAFKKKMSSDNI